MVITKAKTVFKSVIYKKNKDYLSAEVTGTITSLVTVTAANFIFNELGFPEWANSVLTYISQLGLSVTVYTLTYGYVHKKEEDPEGIETKKHISHLAKLGGKVGIVAGLAKFGFHYGLLKTKLLPANYTAPVAYALIGLFSSYFRHKKNYEEGILSINNHIEKDKEQKQEKPASIDEVVG